MKVQFGTDGIRGVAGESPVTVGVAVALGRAVVEVFGAARVAIARDTRPSGADLAVGVAQGVAAAGAGPAYLATLPTSALAVALARDLADVGVMITASHNPAPDNGFKVLGPGGRKLTDAENTAIEDAVARRLGAAGDAFAPVADEHAAGLAAYEAALNAAIGDTSALRGRRIAVDLAAGAATAAVGWLGRLGCELHLLGVDGVINDGVGSEHPERLAAVVTERGLDAGLAVDGDGDRCLLIDERGQRVAGDTLAWLLTVGAGADRLAVTVMSSTALEAALPGVRIVRTHVGDRHLAEAIARGEATLGVEESGHVVFSDALPTGDGLVTGLRALMAAWRRAPRLSEALSFAPFPRRLTKVRVPQRRPLNEVSALQAVFHEAERSLGAHGRVFVRYSGTEPVLRLLVEGPDEAAVVAASERITSAARELLA